MGLIANLREFEPLARTRLSPAAFAYYAGGSWDEQTLRDNHAAFARRRLLPHVLVGSAPVDPSTTPGPTPPEISKRSRRQKRRRTHGNDMGLEHGPRAGVDAAALGLQPWHSHGRHQRYRHRRPKRFGCGSERAL